MSNPKIHENSWKFGENSGKTHTYLLKRLIQCCYDCCVLQHTVNLDNVLLVVPRCLKNEWKVELWEIGRSLTVLWNISRIITSPVTVNNLTPLQIIFSYETLNKTTRHASNDTQVAELGISVCTVTSTFTYIYNGNDLGLATTKQHYQAWKWTH